MLSYKSIILAAAAFSSIVQAQKVISRSECSSGSHVCCQGAGRAYLPPYAALLGLLGVVVDPDTLIGVTCTPITVIGVGGNSCNAIELCCDNNSFNGIIAIGCTIISIGV
ncbi:hypothetical protein BDQ12DRAFT_668662 [Crucibulum laeve]|uniref:Hydrophobin n=1 Tax=Crucibulum laeve TaxID=68775 RepID=A0A5C3LSL6_9AGAR|nr:hypothetical protein BDQ12DRAFT_668662 [Crucibulum laeve]